MQKIADLRKDYAQASLDISDVSKNPIEQFNKWFDDALKSEVTEPNAMCLATVSKDNRPSCRIVLLKGVEQNQFVFYTNYQSHKGRELDDNSFCAVTFFWPELERQVRIEGTASRIDEQRSQVYFQSRPIGSQIGAWASPQSSIIENRAILEDRAVQIEKRFEGQSKLQKPKQWGGYQIDPEVIEFWQGRKSRLHDRIEFLKTNGLWKAHRLAP